MKTRIFAICLAVLCLSLGAAGTLSYLTAKNTVHNVITTGNVNLQLKEDFPVSGRRGNVPGDKITKKVWIKNTGTVPAWVRTSVDIRIQSETGIDLPTILPGDISVVSLELQPEWTCGNDGFYYYQDALDAGEKTTNMIEKIKLSDQITNEYQNCRISIDITGYGVQSAHNGNTGMEAQGWPSV